MSALYTVYVSEFSRRHALNARPVFGLFFNGDHPLSLQVFAEHVKIVYGEASGKRKKTNKPTIYAYTAASGEPKVRFIRSDSPQPFPGELLEFIKEKGGSFTPRQSDPLPSSIVMGFGKHAEEQFGDGFGEVEPGIGYEVQIIVPYAREVRKHLTTTSEKWIGSTQACDYALSYVAPDLIPALYARFPQPPTEQEFVHFVRETYSDTPDYAEQLSRVILVLSSIIEANESISRMMGAGILIFSPHRAIPFPYAFSLSPQKVEWEDLHRFVSARIAQPVLSPYPVAEIEEFPELRFYYSSDLVFHTPQRSYALCRVISPFGAIVDWVVSFPSALLLQIPPYADVSLTRLVLNRQAARKSGVEAWQIQVYGEINAFADLEQDKENILKFLENVANTRERRYRAATK